MQRIQPQCCSPVIRKIQFFIESPRSRKRTPMPMPTPSAPGPMGVISHPLQAMTDTTTKSTMELIANQPLGAELQK